MSEIKPIRTKKDYEEALDALRALIALNPPVGSSEDDKINILSALIEDFESETLPAYQSDPIEAIKLRMDQLGLKDKDLAQYFGSASRVSEILSCKRPLTVSMIKNLEEGLGIPASILVGSTVEKKNKRWSIKTLEKMAKRGYFGHDNTDLDGQEILNRGLVRQIFNPELVTLPSLLRQSQYRDISNIDQLHMDAWSNKVINKGMDIIKTSDIQKYDKTKVNSEVVAKLFKLSTEKNGIKEILDELSKLGIVVVIEPHLPNTKLDGATFFTDNNPIIGLTLRYGRIDYFWFTLAHELSHVLLHIDTATTAFLDNLFGNTDSISELEIEADKLAGDLLIPPDEWKVSPLKYASTPTLVKKFADKIGVHESVVAGRIRHDSGDWVVLNDTVNSFDVRELFGDIVW